MVDISRRLRGGSLRANLALIILLALAPAAALVFLSDLEARREDRSDADQRARQLVRLEAAAVGHLVQGSRHLMAWLTELGPATGDTEATNALLRRLLARNPDYLNLGFIDDRGFVLASAMPPADSIDMSGEPFFTEVRRRGDFVVGGFMVGPITRRPILTLAQPVLDERGRVAQVAVAGLSVDALQKALFEARLPASAQVLLLDRAGRLLASYPGGSQQVGRVLHDHPLGRLILRDDDGFAEMPGIDGIQRLNAFTIVPGSDGALRLCIGLDRDEVFAASDQRRARNFLWLSLVTLGAIITAYLAGNSLLLRRLRILSLTADRISTGDLGARAEVQGRDEIANVAEAFNEMARRLSEMIASGEEIRFRLAEHVGRLVEERTHELDLLNRLGETLQACTAAPEAYDVLARHMPKLFPRGGGAIGIISPSRHLVEIMAQWGEAPIHPHLPVFRPEECWALRLGRQNVMDGASPGVACTHAPRGPGIDSLCTPLMALGETLGVFYLWEPSPSALDRPAADSAPLVVPPPDVTGIAGRRLQARSVAQRIAVALANLGLQETLRSQSIRDPLTGLFNRRYMEESVDREIRRALRSHASVAVIMVDVDHFKRFNDEHGHEAGDVVLKEIGSLLRANLRGGDIACRYGGEEFVLILSDATVEVARHRAGQIRIAASHLKLIHRGNALPPVTLSLGVATFPEHGETREALLQAADEALYSAKNSGRNRVVVAD